MTSQTHITRIRAAMANWKPVDVDVLAASMFQRACNPAAMREVLVHIDQQQAEIERLRAVIVRAKNVMQGGEGVQDQGEAWDLTVRILDAAMKETP